MLIEHDWRLRKLMRANLEAGGLKVQEAVSERHGLQALPESRPDLILLDLDLPDVEPVDLLRALHSRFRDCSVPIIAVSAEPPSRELLGQGYVTSYLRKPFAALALLEQVKLALSKPSKD